MGAWERGKALVGGQEEKSKGWSESEWVRESGGKEGAWLGVLGCLMDEGVVGLVGAVSPE